MYTVPATSLQVESIVKKSRFIAAATYANDRFVALQAVKSARQGFPDAGHHCWAYLIGSPANPATVAMSDDGEPSGTAGKPILNVLQHKGVGNIVIVVSRYFGGIKLGAGGLVRAYSGAAQSVMERLEVTQYVARVRVCVSIAFSQEQDLRHWLSKHQGAVLQTEYSQQVECELELAETEKALLQQTAIERGWQILSN